MNTKLRLANRFSVFARSCKQAFVNNSRNFWREASSADAIPGEKDLPNQPAPMDPLEATVDVIPEVDAQILWQQLQQAQEELRELRMQLEPIFNKRNILKLLRHTWAPFIILLLELIPFSFVIRHTWLGDLSLANFERDQLWCKVDFLCQTRLPSYFIVVYAGFIILFILMLFLKFKPVILLNPNQVVEKQPDIPSSQVHIGRVLRWVGVISFIGIVWSSISLKTIPGWELLLTMIIFLTGWILHDIRLEKAFGFVKNNLDYILALSLSHITLIALLFSIYSAPQILWGAAILFALGFINLFRFIRRISPAFWLLSLSCVFLTININGWSTSFIGDEYSSFDTAQALVQSDFWVLGTRLFSAEGNYGNTPFIASIPQAISMRLLGSDGFGWRFSEMYVSALSAVLLYFFLKLFLNHRAAIIAAFLIGISHYLMSFGRIGYGILPALLAESLILFAAGRVIRTRRPLAYCGAGLALGFAFYVYPAALYTIPLLFLLLLIYSPPINRKTIGNWALMLGVLFMCIFPLLLQPVYWQSKLPGTFLVNPEITQSSSSFFTHFTQNLLYTITIFLYNPNPSHYITAANVDPLTAIMIPLGFICMLKWAIKKPFALFTILGYGVLCILAGASHDREFPPNTRVFVLLPFYAIFAAVGVEWVIDRLKQVQINRTRQITMLLVVLAIVSLGLNYFNANVLSYQSFASQHWFESLFLRMSYRLHDLEPDVPKNFVVITDVEWSPYLLEKFGHIYPLIYNQARFSRIIIDTPQVSESHQPLLSDRNTMVMVMPWVKEEILQGVKDTLQKWGKQSCMLKTAKGEDRVLVYYSPELAYICEP